ncbi:MAG: DUF2141 domain-containing protein [Melioribacteraceae bacterium]|nr:DUF2141 domain-containing protein [Melioribacteraceae bacterium]
MNIIKTLFILAITTSNIFGQTDSTNSVNIIIENIDTEVEGSFIIKLFNNEENWLEKGLETEIKNLKVFSDSIIVKFNNLKIGNEYAISVLHDEDNDEELDMSFFPPGPSEGVGVSNNKFRLGPPSWEDAKFLITKDTLNLIIEMNY